MDEFKFVLKCFLFASLIMIFSQVKTGGLTIESKVEIFLTDSTTAHYMQTAAQGGAKALGEMYDTTKAFISNKMGNGSNHSTSNNRTIEPAIEEEEDRI